MTQPEIDYLAGWFTGRRGGLALCPPGIADAATWHAGHADGSAARQRQIDRAAARQSP